MQMVKPGRALDALVVSVGARSEGEGGDLPATACAAACIAVMVFKWSWDALRVR